MLNILFLKEKKKKLNNKILTKVHIENDENKQSCVKLLKTLFTTGKYCNPCYIRVIKNIGELKIIGIEYFNLTTTLIGFRNVR